MTTEEIAESMKPLIAEWIKADEEYNHLIEKLPGQRQPRVKELLSSMLRIEREILNKLKQ